MGDSFFICLSVIIEGKIQEEQNEKKRTATIQLTC